MRVATWVVYSNRPVCPACRVEQGQRDAQWEAGVGYYDPQPEQEVCRYCGAPAPRPVAKEADYYDTGEVESEEKLD